MRIEALLSRGPSAPTELVEAELEGPRTDEVVVRIEAVGVCHTDVATRAGLGAAPAVLGHEGCGIVEQIGAGVTDLTVGERVVISFRSCGECSRCLAGSPAYCDQMGPLNNGGRRLDGSAPISVDGAPVYSSFFGQSPFATHAVAAASACVPVGEVAPEVAAPLGCGFLTGAGAVLNVLRSGDGARLVVLGGGGVGAAATLTALSEGVEVVVVDPLEQRRDLAASFGARTATTLDEAPGSFTHALDTTGRPDVIASALGRLEKQGVLAVVGLGPATAEIDVRDLMLRGLQLRGCVEGDAVPRDRARAASPAPSGQVAARAAGDDVPAGEARRGTRGPAGRTSAQAGAAGLSLPARRSAARSARTV